jgi:hypothetical protein
VHEIYRERILKKVWLPALVKKEVAIIYSIFEKIACKMFDGIVGVIDSQASTSYALLLSQHECLFKRRKIFK